jgi:hypothetical protein
MGKFIFKEHRSQERTEIRERFIKPESIPPLHCNQVSEPHVGEFMDNHPRHERSEGDRDFVRLIDELKVVEGNASREFHCAYSEFGTHDEVPLFVRVFISEEFLEEFDAFDETLEHESALCDSEFCFTFSTVKVHDDIVITFILRKGMLLIWPGNKTEQVSTHELTLFKNRESLTFLFKV